jgi:selenide,water dikinase
MDNMGALPDTPLTSFTRNTGCSCKISPQVLEQIIKPESVKTVFPGLLVGNESLDDAAVMDLGDGTALISTTDFFTPIVDEPFEFGRIAAANALSDVYAMGGKPLMALAILGWPVDKLPAALAADVIAGARAVCEEAGMPLAGGHSIDSTDPFFGLSVNGRAPIKHIKKNSNGKEGDWLFLTKPIGSGILSTARKRGLLQPEHNEPLLKTMGSLNNLGESIGSINGIHALTDVTGFGLLGHLWEMANGSGLSTELYYDSLKLLPGVSNYIQQRIFPDSTTRNWSRYQSDIQFEKGVPIAEAFTLLPDPQTNGGLLIAVGEEEKENLIHLLKAEGLGEFAAPIGKLIPIGEKKIVIKPSLL